MIKINYINGIFSVQKESDFQSLKSHDFGIKKDNSLFELETYEVLFLSEKKKIDVYIEKRKLSFENILKLTKISFKDFIVYRDLKTKGYIVKSGLKYGFTFRVYDKGIKEEHDHALWFVKPIFETNKLKIRELSGENRVAHTAKKKMILAIVDAENNVTYLETAWKRL